MLEGSSINRCSSLRSGSTSISLLELPALRWNLVPLLSPILLQFFFFPARGAIR